MNATFVKAFRQVVREEILKKNRITVGGLGRFEIVHDKQRQEQLESGQVVMMPPKDRIQFTPDKKEAS